MDNNNTLLLTDKIEAPNTEQGTSSTKGRIMDYIPVIAMLALKNNNSQLINPEIKDILIDIAPFMPQKQANNIERISHTIDYLSRINSPSQISVVRNENPHPMEIYSTLKKYIPLPFKQTMDMLITSAGSIKGLKRDKSTNSDPLDSIISTLSTMRNIKRSIGMAGAAAELLGGASQNTNNDAPQKINTPDFSKIAELMGAFLSKK